MAALLVGTVTQARDLAPISANADRAASQGNLDNASVTFEPGYTPGETVDLIFTFNYSVEEPFYAASLVAIIPDGWTVSNDDLKYLPGNPSPAVFQPATGEVNLFWSTALGSSNPGETTALTFPASVGGSIQGDMSQTVDSGADCSAVIAVADDGYAFDKWTCPDYDDVTDTELTVANVQANMTRTANFKEGADYHSADTSKDWMIDVLELLRVVTLFNNGLYYATDAETIDGYAPSSTEPIATDGYHDSDFNPADWKIDVVELLRAVTLYNNGLYYATDPGSVDGFKPSATDPSE